MRRRHKDRGATLIEASLVLPIMIAIMIGTLELGLAFKDYLNTSFTAREAARVGALAGNDSDADCAIIDAVVSELDGNNLINNLIGLQVYQTDPATGNQIAGKINTFVLKPGGDPTICDTLNWNVTTYGYPPASRNTAYGTSSDLDIIGVRVAVLHNWITGVPPFTGSFWVDEHSITRMEPESFE